MITRDSTSQVLHFDHPGHPDIRGSGCQYPCQPEDRRVYDSPSDLSVEQINRIANKKWFKRQGRGRPRHPVYRYRGEQVNSIWTGGELRPVFARQLRPELRIVMGFWRQHSVPTLRKTELSGCKDSGEFLDLNRKLLTAQEFIWVDAIRHCILHGLPLSAAVEMPSSIVCRNCGNRTRLLPCINCWRGLDDDPTVDAEEVDHTQRYFTDDEIRATCKPTKAEPGTSAKVKVLAKRAEKGLPLWHPDDPVFDMSSRQKWWSHD